ncbi:energy transducer TonB [Fluviicola taffensis]|uniref:energy transducer TonB n=1 Tax=Fluviicola taffensis TaxID=191579 RepID=UPI0031379125
MKLLLFLLLIIGSDVVFGQSAKKINTQLRAELLVHQQKQDSSEKVFLEEAEILEQVRDDIRIKTKTNLYPEDKKWRKTASSITGLINTLKYLEIDTKEVYPDGADFNFLPKYQTFVKPLSKARDQFVEFHALKKDELNVDEYKRKEQNELLKQLIRKYQDYEKRNQMNIQTQRNYIEQITSFYPRIDSLLQVYQALNTELESKNDLLLKKLELARENYRLKGPNGFSKAYRDQFPEVHPIMIERIESIDFGVETTEGFGGRDNVGSIEGELLVAPKTVEPVPELEIFDVTDEQAEFPGGRAALLKYLSENIRYPQIVKEMGIQPSTQYVQFVVSDRGSISNVQMKKGVKDCPECDAEVIRVVKAMPNWIPAKNNGKAVKSWYSLPINIELD